MKVRLTLLFLFSLLIFNCKEENKIEIIPDYNKIYLPLDEVDETPQLLVGEEEELIKKINSYITASIDSTKHQLGLDYNFLLNESGTIEKVVIVRSESEKIDNIVLNAIKDWQFKPGRKDGKDVKSQFRWKFYYGGDKAIKPINEGIYFVAVQKMPELIGGLYSIQKNIIYPEIAKRAGIEGKVYVLAFIDEQGDVVNARIIKGIGAGCDEAALQAVKLVKFKPGQQEGKPVKTQVSIPIVFKLQ